MAKNRAQIGEISGDDLTRIGNLLQTIGGPHVVWGAQQTLDVLLVEERLEADRLASRRIVAATWVLAGATVALVLATIGLIVASLNGS